MLEVATQPVLCCGRLLTPTLCVMMAVHTHQ